MRQVLTKIIVSVIVLAVSIVGFILAQNFVKKYNANKIEANSIEIIIIKENTVIKSKTINFTDKDKLVDLLEKNFRNNLSFDNNKERILSIETIEQDETHNIEVYLNEGKTDKKLTEIELTKGLKIKFIEVSV